jgi:uridine kinase
MRRLASHPLFWVGLLIRLAMLWGVTAETPVAQGYLAFLRSSLTTPSPDPWMAFLNQGGAPAAFPYGHVMWLVMLPLSLLAHLASLDLRSAYGMTLLAADIGLLAALAALVRAAPHRLLAGYWLSPIVIYATYWLGLNDVIPMALLTGALLALLRQRALASGLLCATAISAKLSMALAVPLLLVYLVRNPPVRGQLKGYLAGLALGGVALALAFMASPGALTMISGTPELQKVVRLALPVGQGIEVFVLPLAYALTLYLAWGMRRIGFDLLITLLGLVFLLVLVLTPAAPGWFLWVAPLFALFHARADRPSIVLAGGFGLTYILSSLINPQAVGASSLAGASLLGGRFEGLAQLAPSIAQTALVAMGAVLILRIWQQVVSGNDAFRISRRPVIMGVSGDSGAGKDTLVDALAGLFGEHSTVRLSGDDYHLWDRHRPLWRALTHLNPRANDLEAFARDAISLADRRPILARRYDHAAGKRSKLHRVDPNDFVLVSGLHALYLPVLRERLDLKIFLDIDEDLRRHFKMARDVHYRGHSREKVIEFLDRRAVDSRKFIQPQAAYADLLLGLKPAQPRLLNERSSEPVTRFKLHVRSPHGLHEETLIRVLVGVCGLNVDVQLSGDNSTIEAIIEGDCTADDVALAAAKVFPDIAALLDARPQWADGMLGVMQLAVLSQLNQALRKRLQR